jgi:hypothetical protein
MGHEYSPGRIFLLLQEGNEEASMDIGKKLIRKKLAIFILGRVFLCILIGAAVGVVIWTTIMVCKGINLRLAISGEVDDAFSSLQTLVVFGVLFGAVVGFCNSLIEISKRSSTETTCLPPEVEENARGTFSQRPKFRGREGDHRQE